MSSDLGEADERKRVRYPGVRLTAVVLDHHDAAVRLQELYGLCEHGVGCRSEVERVGEEEAVDAACGEVRDCGEIVHIGVNGRDGRVCRACSPGIRAQLAQGTFIGIDGDDVTGRAEQLREGEGKGACAGADVDPCSVEGAGGGEEGEGFGVGHTAPQRFKLGCACAINRNANDAPPLRCLFQPN
jgi:hypothetical protein